MTKEQDINALIGKRTVLLRNQKGLSRSKLAKILNIAHQQLDKYEKGKNRISAAKIAIICQELKVDPLFFYLDLVIEKNITEDIKNDLNTLITHFVQINNDSKRGVIINLVRELIPNLKYD